MAAEKGSAPFVAQSPITQHPALPSRPRPTRRPTSGGRGVVLVVVLLGLLFVAGLLAYVFNLGQQTQARTKLQHAADAGAVSGPGELARVFNAVAMNNVATANMVGVINNLDAMPRTVLHTRLDQEALLEGLEGQLRRGVPVPQLRVSLANLRDEVAGEVEDLQQMQAVYDRVNVSGITAWDAPNGGRGTAWQAMDAMDQWSQALVANVPDLAGTAAESTMAANLPDERGGTGVLLSTGDGFPMQRGQWWDYENPVRYGQLPWASQMPVVRRGPFDTLFGWRDGYYLVSLLEVPRGGGFSGNGSGLSGWSGRGDQVGSQWQVLTAELLQCGTFGPHDAIRRHLSGVGDDLQIFLRLEAAGDNGRDLATGFLYHRLRDPLTGIDRTPVNPTGQIVPNGTRGALEGVLPWSRASDWHRQLVSAKAAMAWGGASTRQIIEPNWVLSYAQAENDFNEDPSVVHETCFVRVILHSRYENGVLVSGPTEYDVDVLWQGGYHAEPPGLGDSRIGLYIWHDPIEDRSVVLGANGQNIQRIDRYDNYFVWIAANEGERVDIDNPYDGFEPNEGPAPVDFVHDQWAFDANGIDNRLRFLSIAGMGNDSELMARRFDAADTDPHAMAMSQSVVFNNHSQDLWTQMWRVQMTPVGSYSGWLDRLRNQQLVNGIEGTDTTTLDWMTQTMEAGEPQANVLLRH